VARDDVELLCGGAQIPIDSGLIFFSFTGSVLVSGRE